MALENMDGALDDYISKTRPGKGGQKKENASNAGKGGRPQPQKKKSAVDGAIDMALDDVIEKRPGKGKGKGKREKGGKGKGGPRGGKGGKGGGFDDIDTGGYSVSGLKGRGRRYEPYDGEGAGGPPRGGANGYGKWTNDMFDDRGPPPRSSGGKGGGYRAKGGGDRWEDDGGGGANKVFVDNLDYSIMAEDLEELFGSVGTVQKAWINYDSTDRSEGNGGCMFVSGSEARRAVQRYNGSTIEGLKIVVSLDHSKGKGGKGKGKVPW